jgi:nicotinamidase-related amidase
MTFLTTAELKAKTSKWARACSLQPDFEIRNDFDAPALLVLDMENEFLVRSGQMKVWGGPAIIPNVLALVSAFRAKGYPVIYTRHVCLEPYKHKDTLRSMSGINDLAQFLRDGSNGAKLCRQLRPTKKEFVITKYKYSAFYDTPLDTHLRVNQIRQVVISGVASNICCDSTARDAFYRGYKVYFPIDGNGGMDEPTHVATLRTMALSFGQLCQVKHVLTHLRSAPATTTKP